MFNTGTRRVRPPPLQHTFWFVTSIIYYDMSSDPTTVSANLLRSQKIPTYFTYKTSLWLMRRFSGGGGGLRSLSHLLSTIFGILWFVYCLRYPITHLHLLFSVLHLLIFYLISSSFHHPSSTFYLLASFFDLLSSIFDLVSSISYRLSSIYFCIAHNHSVF